MPGTNKSFKKGQIVFKAGDPSDGMYIVRKGELQVFLEQSGKETLLAKIPQGGMVGEMALFDKQPRSASVRAVADAELTQITNDDFGKLMKQIPNWFVSLMTALSTRLRITNDRLQKAEAGIQGSSTSLGAAPFQHSLRLLTMLDLLWSRDGVKEGKDWAIARSVIEEFFNKSFPDDLDRIKRTIDAMIAEGFLSTKTDDYNRTLLVMPNKAALAKLCDFVSLIVQKSGLTMLPSSVLTLTRVFEAMAAKSNYETFTASVEDLEATAKELEMDSSGFREQIQLFDKFGDMVKLVRTESKTGLGLRGEKAQISLFGKLMRAVAALQKHGLA